MCSPAPFFFGLTQLLNYDYFSVASFTNKLGMVVIRTEGILNFLLALNRMKIVCEVKIHPVVFKVPLTGFITYSCYCLNTLFVPPFLYLCLNASLREEFFGRKKTAKVAAVRSVIGSMKA
ncbi:hypothetical protein QR680_010043 [Steinernema hermaphroditum]|uniref:Uncharacterized protein n=1 Tax=Steinernema hermaphroditum TaxID=289476 RepID=A0AA39IMI6_9BILA|nr:hypothetical protein QR680_010043 [Steinernema hermaphroditum]